MKFILSLFSAVMVFPFLLLSSVPIKTDYAIFLFDNGDKNMIASMLKYAEEKDKSTLDDLDFRIIFMGASIDAMTKEPFSHFPGKLLHYKTLGVEETIDHNWKRGEKLSSKSLSRLAKNITIRKKVWVGVSCSIFEQIAQNYQDKVVALRDNPSPDGDTDYFKIAREVQKAASQVAVPSKAVLQTLDPHKKTFIIGHAPIEEWVEEAKRVNKDAIKKQLGLDLQRPVVVYAGVYGGNYEASFTRFLEIAAHQNIQVLIAPHPRFKGVLEARICKDVKEAQFQIVGEFVEDPSQKIRSLDALCIADVVVTADPTSTIVFQANALGKKVLLINPISTAVGDALCAQKFLCRVSSSEEFLEKVNAVSTATDQDIFALLGIPKQGAKLLWHAFLDGGE